MNKESSIMYNFIKMNLYYNCQLSIIIFSFFLVEKKKEYKMSEMTTFSYKWPNTNSFVSTKTCSIIVTNVSYLYHPTKRSTSIFYQFLNIEIHSFVYFETNLQLPPSLFIFYRPLIASCRMVTV